MQPRYYQREATDAIYRYWSNGGKGNVIVQAPTGSGKSMMINMLCREVVEGYNARVLVLSHVQEILKQNHDGMIEFWPNAPIGIYSAGLGRKEIESKILYAGIQSIYDKVHKLKPAPEIVIIDECHLVSRSPDSMYAKALNHLRLMQPDMRCVGYTATPYRLDSGWLHKPYGDDKPFFSDIVYDIPIQDLIDQGFLCRITAKSGSVTIDTAGVGKLGGEYKSDELEQAAMRGDTTQKAVSDLIQRGKAYKSWILFACGVNHARQIVDELERHGIAAGLVVGDTEKGEREELISAHKSNELRAIVNVNVLTVGYNNPNVDLIGFLRPTLSTALYVQALGRGMRMAPGKSHCLVLDYSGNCLRHGPIDAVNPDKKKRSEEGVAPAKECKQCGAIVHAALRYCPECGAEFPPNKPKVETKAAHAPLLKADIEPEKIKILKTSCQVWSKAGKTNSVRINYLGDDFKTYSEWIFPKADTDRQAWFYDRWCTRAGLKKPYPASASEFVDRIILDAEAVYTIPDGQYTRIVKHDWREVDVIPF
jgi:DNA repair protein RadD